MVFRWMMIDRYTALTSTASPANCPNATGLTLFKSTSPTIPDVVAKAKAALTAEESAVVQAALGNVQYKWARERQPDGKFIDKSFDGMLKDIEKAEGTAAMKNFIYDVSSTCTAPTLTRLSTGCDSSRRLGGSSSSRANWDSIAAIALWR